MTEVNQVFKTTDYSLFKIIDGNRNINQLHLKRLKKSIEEKYIMIPIIVNQHYEIIDGQHRFESAKELKKPIYYIMVNDLGLKDVQRLNSNLKNWNADDYLDGYCKLGYSNYIKYREFKKQYGFNHNETAALLSNNRRYHGYKNNLDFKNGTFEIRDYDEAVNNANKISMISQYYDGYKRRNFVYAMLDVFTKPDYNHAEFLNKLSFQSRSLVDCTDVQQYLTLIEEIYNYKRSNKVNLRF